MPVACTLNGFLADPVAPGGRRRKGCDDSRATLFGAALHALIKKYACLGMPRFVDDFASLTRGNGNSFTLEILKFHGATV